MLTTLACNVSGLIGVGIMLIGARFLLAPHAAAAGYGVTAEPLAPNIPAASPDPRPNAKGVHDIASGLFIFILLAYRAPHVLGAFMAAASLIPVGDAVIVLRAAEPALQPLASTER